MAKSLLRLKKRRMYPTPFLYKTDKTYSSMHKSGPFQVEVYDLENNVLLYSFLTTPYGEQYNERLPEPSFSSSTASFPGGYTSSQTLAAMTKPPWPSIVLSLMAPPQDWDQTPDATGTSSVSSLGW
jgi:hypothetical protein